MKSKTKKTDNPNYFKDYYQRNKDKMKENSRKHYLKKKGCSSFDYKLIVSHKPVLVCFD